MDLNREIICTICPKGCHISLKAGSPDSGGRINTADICGNKCKRGIAYALNEFTNPVRMLTTTVRINGGDMSMIPVKSGKPLPKGLLMECMKIINGYTAEAPAKRGDVLIKDILGTGVDIVAAGNVFRGKGK